LLRTLNVSLIGAEFSLIGRRKFPVSAEQELAANGLISHAKSAPPAPQQADFR
jgi:hypothetical protein